MPQNGLKAATPQRFTTTEPLQPLPRPTEKNLTDLDEVPALKGSDFCGYYTDPYAKGTQFIDGNGKGCAVWNIASDATLYAAWGYSITYRNTKDAENENPEAYTGEVDAGLVPLEKKGYRFEGWFDSETGGNRITDIQKGSTGEKTLYAHWYLGTKAPTEAKSVGDIVFTDGSAMPYSYFDSIDDGDDKTSKKNSAIALIFYRGTELNSGDDTSTSRTLGVGLKHDKNGIVWCIESANAYEKNITTIQCVPDEEEAAFTGDKNGSDNLSQIAAFLTENASADDTATAAELFQIYVNGKGSEKVFDIDAASDALGGDRFEGSGYWSSSQFDAYEKGVNLLYFSNGSRYIGTKTDDWYKYVCCIRAF